MITTVALIAVFASLTVVAHVVDVRMRERERRVREWLHNGGPKPSDEDIAKVMPWVRP